jgi:hypothetical protein
MSIVKDDKSWRIVGEGAERAVLAFAKIVDGKLVYELAAEPTGGRHLHKARKSQRNALRLLREESVWS